MNLSIEEIARYDRHLKLKEVGVKGQEALKNAKVLVVGAGGLGSPILQYLSAAGIGTIGIVDNDTVDESNLQRQVLYTVESVGKSKVSEAIKALLALNPHIEFIAHDFFLDRENVLDTLAAYDIIIDGTDNFSTRYLVGDATAILKKPLVFGSIFKLEGQVAVFNLDNGPTYRCLFPSPPEEDSVPNCSEIGVLGVLPGYVGTAMANECLKLILKNGKVLSGKVRVMNLLENTQLDLNITANPENIQRTKLEESYDFSCDTKSDTMKSITAKELSNTLSNEDIQLIDVREPFEYEICSIEKSKLIPLNSIPNNLSEIEKEKKTVVICHHGMRSAAAINYLEQQGFNNLINLTGGIHAWALEVDPEMNTY